MLFFLAAALPRVSRVAVAVVVVVFGLPVCLFAFNVPRNRDVFCREFVKRDAASRFYVCLFA